MADLAAYITAIVGLITDLNLLVVAGLGVILGGVGYLIGVMAKKGR